MVSLLGKQADSVVAEMGGPVLVSEDANGVKTMVEYRVDEQGRKVKITRKVRLVLTKQKARHAVAERKHLAKFGAAGGGKVASFDDGITSLGEEVSLKLAVQRGHDKQEATVSVADQVKKMQSSKIICRVCKGDHWTTKCPYKDTLQPLEELIDKSTGGAAEGASSSGTGAASGFGAGGSGKYVPPSLRNKMPSDGSAPPSGRSRDDTPTVRVTNLSEDAEEQDLHVLFQRFGPISRVFLSRDRETGLCKGFAFINFYSKEDAEKAIATMHGYGFDNLILNVEWAKQ